MRFKWKAEEIKVANEWKNNNRNVDKQFYWKCQITCIHALYSSLSACTELRRVLLTALYREYTQVTVTQFFSTKWFCVQSSSSLFCCYFLGSFIWQCNKLTECGGEIGDIVRIIDHNSFTPFIFEQQNKNHTHTHAQKKAKHKTTSETVNIL